MRMRVVLVRAAHASVLHRYVVQLLTPTSILAKTSGHTKITKSDLQEASSLFLDAKASAQMLREQSQFYLK